MTIPTYQTGTVSVTAAGTIVTGVGTIWSGINVKQGDWIKIGAFAPVLVTEVTDTTHLKIPAWPNATQSGVAYIIYQDYSGRVVGVAAAEDVADMLERLKDQAPVYNVPTGEAAPDPSYGVDGQWAYQFSTGLWWLKTGGVWTITAPPLSSGGPGTATPLVDITPAVVGTSLLYSRQDHRHPVDTSRAAASALPLPSNTNPLVNGSVAQGSSLLYSRQDHVHPVDTSRAPTTNPTFAGTVTAQVVSVTGGGIAYPAIVVPNAGANVLDDYEEGTWTPILSFGGASTGITYGTQGGQYTKIGNLVRIACAIQLTSKGSATGNVLISGLPFAHSAFVAAFALYCDAMTSGTGDNMLQAIVSGGATTIGLFKIAAGGSFALTHNDFTNTSNIFVTGTYQAASGL